MIAIIKTSKGLTGKQTYRLQINQELICKFKHVREEGLAECLRRAAEAVDK